MVPGREKLKLGSSDNHYLHVHTNLFSKSGTAALTQEQSCFGPLHGYSEHHIALSVLEMVVYGLTTVKIPLGGKLQGHLEEAGAWLQYYLVPHTTTPAADQQLSSDWQWVWDDSWGRPGHQDLAKKKTNKQQKTYMNCIYNPSEEPVCTFFVIWSGL